MSNNNDNYMNNEEISNEEISNEEISNEEISNEEISNEEIVKNGDGEDREKGTYSTYYGSIESFEDLDIDKNIKLGIIAYGYENPSPIQQRGILPILAGRDIIAQAQSGTGKTATFCIGTLGIINPDENNIQALILVHTRELALQIHTVFKEIGKYTNIRFNLSIRGIPPRENIDALKGGSKNQKPHIVIGTPGRIMDMIRKGALVTKDIKLLVIDEADEMLSEGFIDQIHEIFIKLPQTSKTALFSATMNENFFGITKKFMNKPIKILIKTEKLTLEGIKQFYINVEKHEYKFDTLCDIFSVLTINQSIIYCNSQRIVEILNNKLLQNNFTVSYIHGNMSSSEREITMSKFRNGTTKVLIATDLLGRGIDIQQVSVVINYDVPTKVESYIHRIGRSGRYGRKGLAINFMTYYDKQKIENIEKYYSTMIDELPGNFNELI
jgi:translation initiation factor 4A